MEIEFQCRIIHVLKVPHSLCFAHRDRTSLHLQSQKKNATKNAQSAAYSHSSTHLSKSGRSKFSRLGQGSWTMNFPMLAGFRGRQRQTATLLIIKARVPETFPFIDHAKAFDRADHNRGKSRERWDTDHFDLPPRSARMHGQENIKLTLNNRLEISK